MVVVKIKYSDSIHLPSANDISNYLKREETLCFMGIPYTYYVLLISTDLIRNIKKLYLSGISIVHNLKKLIFF